MILKPSVNEFLKKKPALDDDLSGSNSCGNNFPSLHMCWCFDWKCYAICAHC